ncbi:MAG: hypothetical protein ACXVHB_33260 [Solirubrobacteraceae bacterium]
MTAYPYVWYWRQKPGWNGETPPRVFDRERKGERCRLLAVGTLNSVLIEFEDGHRTVTCRMGLRKPNQTKPAPGYRPRPEPNHPEEGSQ